MDGHCFSCKIQVDAINSAFRSKTAEIAENYLQKGSKIALEGRLVHRTYETKEGEKKFFTEVVANSLMMLDPKST